MKKVKLIIRAFFIALKTWLRSKNVVTNIERPQAVPLTTVELENMAMQATKNVQEYKQFKSDVKHLTYEERRKLGIVKPKINGN